MRRNFKKSLKAIRNRQKKQKFLKKNDDKPCLKNRLEMKKASRTELDGFEVLVLEVGEPVYRPTE